ncbi:transposable element Tcb2 transposase [Trichonephila clavipes]|nr:transposable element Tcb2 transposase [Trichonephila clavipes]
MDDNCRPHRANLVEDFLFEEGIVRMEWPACFPDMNPIEHVWVALGRRVAGRRPPPQTLQEMERALLEVWDRISQFVINSLIDPMSQRTGLPQELTIDELIEMHEQEQGIEELESIDRVQTEDEMTFENRTEGISLIENYLTELSCPLADQIAHFFVWSNLEDFVKQDYTNGLSYSSACYFKGNHAVACSRMPQYGP